MQVGEVADGEEERQQEQEHQGELRSRRLVNPYSPAVVAVFALLGEGAADQEEDPAEEEECQDARLAAQRPLTGGIGAATFLATASRLHVGDAVVAAIAGWWGRGSRWREVGIHKAVLVRWSFDFPAGAAVILTIERYVAKEDSERTSIQATSPVQDP
jgi:hypothetical protein